jgi:hypothetical protein
MPLRSQIEQSNAERGGRESRRAVRTSRPSSVDWDGRVRTEGSTAMFFRAQDWQIQARGLAWCFIEGIERPKWALCLDGK